MGVAQFGSALEWGSRGRGFKSLHPYQQKHVSIEACFLFDLQSLKKGLERVGIADIQPKKRQAYTCLFIFLNIRPHSAL